MKISKIITDKYKLLIPPTVYYDLLADVVEAEEEQEPCEDCDYSEIMDWEQDAKTGKAKPIYWCERHKEPCDDAVSRQAVLGVLMPYCADDDGSVENTNDLRNALDDIESLPPVQPIRLKGKWIPVSERLPEKSVWVLVYCKTTDGCEYQTVLLRGKYTGEWTDCDDFYDEVIAWMPLPEPYQTESEDKNT